MDMDSGAIFFPAIVEKKIRKNRYVVLQLRRHRESFSAPKRKSFEVKVVLISDDDRAQKLYLAATKLRKGDEIYVEYGTHDELMDPTYHNIFRRWWNRIFG